jgi:hypothetical protein
MALAVESLDRSGESADRPTARQIGTVGRAAGRAQRKDSEDSKVSQDSTGSSAYIIEEQADATPNWNEPEGEEFKQTSSFRAWETSRFRTEKLRSWEQKMRKHAVMKESPPPEDLHAPHRFWEEKLRKGELDPLLQKSRATWLLDKAAKIPETLQMGPARTFWEVKETRTEENGKRCLSMPVRERPPSLNPSVRIPLREGFENCTQDEQDVLQAVFQEYFAATDAETLRKSNAGRTFMLKDLRNKFSIEDLLGIFDEIGAEHVDYVFLPLSVWETKSKSRQPSQGKVNLRNKAYCFVHFSDVAASDVFVERLASYEFPNEARSDGAEAEVRAKKMHASLSATQGIVPNLLRLMDIHSRKWHPRAGAMAIRVGDTLVPVHVAALRKYLVEILKEHPTTAPGCLREQHSYASDKSPPKTASQSAGAA